MRSETVALLSNREIAPNVCELVLPCPLPVGAGRFFMLKSMAGATLLARPISVCDAAAGAVTFLVQRVGRGTTELCALRAGDLVQLTGPLGNGFPLDEVTGKIALVGGGIGIAPMLLTAKRLRESGNPADCYLGYRSTPFYEQEIGRYAKGLFLSTDDGCAGFHGTVVEMLEPGKYDAVFCCGPMRMMQAVTELCKQAGTPVYVSMENKMSCGIGACLVCTCRLKQGGNVRTCMDGPVLRGEEICFDA